MLVEDAGAESTYAIVILSAFEVTAVVASIPFVVSHVAITAWCGLPTTEVSLLSLVPFSVVSHS